MIASFFYDTMLKFMGDFSDLILTYLNNSILFHLYIFFYVGTVHQWFCQIEVIQIKHNSPVILSASLAISRSVESLKRVIMSVKL